MNEVLKWYEDNTYYSVKSGNVTFDIQNDDYWEFHRLLTNQCIELDLKDKEIQRLNNIINELEKYLKEEAENLHDIVGDNFTTVGQTIYKEVLNKLKELRG